MRTHLLLTRSHSRVAKVHAHWGLHRSGTPQREMEARVTAEAAGRRASLEAGRCTPGATGRAEAGLTRARCGPSEARNGTFPLDVACQSAKEHGTAARGAVALWRGRERKDFKNFSPPSQSNFQRALSSMNFRARVARTRGCVVPVLSHTHEGG